MMKNQNKMKFEWQL